jgi:hypothetical protein
MKFSSETMLLAAVVTFSSGCINSHVRQMVGSAIADGADTQVKYSV